MSSVPDPRVSVQPAITRHGTARLFIAIGSSLYSLIPSHGGNPPAWDLVQKQGASPRTVHGPHHRARPPRLHLP